MSVKNILKAFLSLLIIYFSFNAFRIYQFSKTSTTQNADIAIVLGAGTSKGKVSPVFKERVNHSIKLYKEKRIEKIVFTGGFGEDETISDSEAAKNYAKENGVLTNDILIEKKSAYTIENLFEAKLIMDSLGFETTLLVSDPIHMKRSICLAKKMEINCFSSPTETSMYKSKMTKFKFLLYETFFFTLGEISGKN